VRDDAAQGCAVGLLLLALVGVLVAVVWVALR